MNLVGGSRERKKKKLPEPRQGTRRGIFIREQSKERIPILIGCLDWEKTGEGASPSGRLLRE